MKAFLILTLCAGLAIGAPPPPPPTEPTLDRPARLPTEPSLEEPLGRRTAPVAPPPAVVAATPLPVAAAPMIAPRSGTIPGLTPAGKATPAPALLAPFASISINAKEIGTGKGVDRKWQTDYGSYDRDYYRTKGIEVEVRNISHAPTGECKVTICWVARQMSGTKSARISHAETLATATSPIGSSSVRFWSPLIAARDTKYVALGERHQAGEKVDGWFVIVSRDDFVIDGKASTESYKELIKSPERLQPLLAAYRPSGRSATSGMPTWRTDPIRKTWGRQFVTQD